MRINDKVIEIFESLKTMINNPESQPDNINIAHYNLIINRYNLSGPDSYGVIDALFSFASNHPDPFPPSNPIFDITTTFIKYYLEKINMRITDFCHALLDENSDFLNEYRKTHFYNDFFERYIKGAQEILTKEHQANKFWSLNVYKICLLDTLDNAKRFLFLASQTNKIEYLIKVGYKYSFKSIDDISDEKLKSIPEVYNKIITLSDVFVSTILNIDINYGLFKESKNLLNYYYDNLEKIAMIIKLFENELLINSEKVNVYTYSIDLKKISFVIRNLNEFYHIITIFEKEEQKNILIQLLFSLNKAGKHISYSEILSNGKLLNKAVNDIYNFNIKLNKVIKDIVKNNPQEVIRLLDVKFEVEKYMNDSNLTPYQPRQSKCFLKKIFGEDSVKTTNLSKNKEHIKKMRLVTGFKENLDYYFSNQTGLLNIIRSSSVLKEIIYCNALLINRSLFLLKYGFKNS